ncbi:PTS sugar transporter subunit IIA [Sandaracinus amylolyticus]|uniref:PTS IIA-like nitrogen-regulatory protein PtsN n=1 Tax=Sandaracinus amylolyticus TaxID=927083 RepID=A0A0F6W4Y5_9BACT|nr:PTS sugar transporter subunit IIA [Sandaracinus amylolyticus]AKF07542.1 PTS IIA-like nitrogen-regulatory protein PtsN [Sandaracinus amylolyticus]
MRLAELLTVDRIDTDLDARDKGDAIRAMAKLLASGLYPSAGGSAPSVEEVERVLREREAVASTGVGDGVAIPHGRLPGLTRFVGALGIQKDGVAFDAIDGRPASILFALIGPDRAAGEHLKCLARISRALRDDSVRAKLLGAEAPQRALDIVLEVDGA